MREPRPRCWTSGGRTLWIEGDQGDEEGSGFGEHFVDEWFFFLGGEVLKVSGFMDGVVVGLMACSRRGFMKVLEDV